MIDPNNSRPRKLLAITLSGLAALALLLLLLKGGHQLFFKGETPPEVVISSGTIQSGDTLSSLLSSKNISPNDVGKIYLAMNKIFDARRLKPGRVYQVTTSTNNVFKEFSYADDVTRSYVVRKSTSGVFSSEAMSLRTVWKERYVSCEVTGNLYKDLMKQNYDETFVASLVADLTDNIFGWRIDFFTEQRPGDKLEALLSQEYLTESDTPIAGTDHQRVLVASYTGKATRLKENIAVRYREAGAKRDEYYGLDGAAARRLFLRAPFTIGAFRVSSGFNRNRFHPILRVYRPHHGTDYAASVGTPVSAIGKGTVVHAGWKGGYGNCVDIRHNGGYTSRYGHLSRIAVRSGQSIGQGSYIGNVGSSGLSTGPHLHFEMLVNGVQRNFLNMSFPSASSLSKKSLPDFNRVKDGLLARLHQKGSSLNQGTN